MKGDGDDCPHSKAESSHEFTSTFVLFRFDQINSGDYCLTILYSNGQFQLSVGRRDSVVSQRLRRVRLLAPINVLRRLQYFG